MEFNATFIASIISFLVFVFLMNKILYAPMEKIVRERQSYIDENYNQAEENHQKAEELSAEKENKLAKARIDAKANYVSTVSEFKEKRGEIVKNAQNENNNEVNNAYNDLNNISDYAKQNLKGKMTDLANDIVEKVLGYRSEIQGFDNEAVDRILYH